MFAFLHKKIPIPNNVKINTVAWSHEYNHIAIGCEDKKIHMIKADDITTNRTGHSGSKSFNIIQCLEGHSAVITICQWNEVYQKLTTCDNRGMIIMWNWCENQWVEYMMNERPDYTSPVVSVDWSPDGHLICILYDDGYMIVGAVDGTRLWDVKLEMIALKVQWSPDSKLILIAIKSSKPTVLIFDDRGNRVHNFKVNLCALESSSVSLIVGLDWNSFYSNIGHVTANANLIIALSNGRIQLMRNESDASPIVIDTEMSIYCTAWNHTGSIVAICGRNETNGNLIKFLSPSGYLLQTLRLPGKKLISISWDKQGLRLAVAIDNHLLIASIKPIYNWTYFGDTIVYTLSKCVTETTTLTDSIDDCIDSTTVDTEMNTIIFYNFSSKTRRTKHLKKLLCITGYDHHAVIAIKCDSSPSVSRLLDGPSNDSSTLILCNSLGTAIEKQIIDYTATCMCMTHSLVIVAAKDCIIIWSYNSSPVKGESGELATTTSRTTLNNDDNNKVDCVSVVNIGHTIRCIKSNDKNVSIGLEKGEIVIYSLPKMMFIQSIQLDNRIPAFVSLDCDSSKLAIIDTTSTLMMYDLEENVSTTTTTSANYIEKFKRRDVWSFMWSTDEANTFAFTERNKLLLFQEMEAEETIHATGYMCSFTGFEVKTIDLDCLVNTYYNNEDIEQYISTLETRVLSEVKTLLRQDGDFKKGFNKAIEIADAHHSDKLWKLIADESLKALSLEEAELSLIRCKDYLGIQFIKRLNKLQSNVLKKAQVTAYFGDIDTAESLFLSADRSDLAIQLRQKMWQPLHVVRLLQTDCSSVTDNQIKQAMIDAGDYHVDHMNWSAALPYYIESKNLDKVIDGYIATEQYEQLSSLMSEETFTPEGYLKAAHAFLSVGMCEDAVNAFVKIDQITSAIDACVLNNEWQMALKLAQENNIDEIDDLLAQYASHLLIEKKYFDIIELYRKANRIHDAANMILKIIEDVKRKTDINYSPILMKQLYTLIGIVYSSEKKVTTDKRTRSDVTFVRKNTLTSLLREDESLIAAAAIFRAVDRPWRGAEAFHYYILAHKHLYNGNVDCAMRAAYHLLDYDDLLGSEAVFSLLALTACVNRSFALCSKALLRLETLETLDDTQRDAYQSLAISIFTNFSPKESKNVPKSECTHCETLIPDYLNICPSCNTTFKICTATAKPILDATLAWTCKRCLHSAYKSAITSLDYCPLCHECI